MKTLAGWARTWGVSGEALKSFVRRRPDLRVLGAKVGPARGFTPAEAKRIRAAFENRHAAATA